MLNEKEVFKAIELQKEGKSIRAIAKEIKCTIPEISYTLNSYKILENIYSKKIEAVKNKVTNIDINAEIYTSEMIEKEKKLQEWENKLFEEEAMVKLFTKNIIYKYRVKNENFNKKYKKWIQIQHEETKTLKEEHFAATFNLHKEIKEKLDILQDFNNYKFLAKYKYIIFFLLGMASSTAINLIILKLGV